MSSDSSQNILSPMWDKKTPKYHRKSIFQILKFGGSCTRPLFC